MAAAPEAEPPYAGRSGLPGNGPSAARASTRQGMTFQIARATLTKRRLTRDGVATLVSTAQTYECNEEITGQYALVTLRPGRNLCGVIEECHNGNRTKLDGLMPGGNQAVTGVEGAAVAAAGAVAKNVVSDDPKVDGILLDVAKDKGHLDRAAATRARRIETLEAVKLRLVQPLGWLFRTGQYFEGQFQEDMAARLDEIPPEQIATPATSIAAPILEGISHTIDEPNLRELYLNLLASASDERHRDAAHPAFAHVIDQMTASESQALQVFLTDALSGHKYVPAVQVTLSDPRADTGFSVEIHCLTPTLTVVDELSSQAEVLYEQLGIYYDNWQRLGLIEVSFVRYPSYSTAFDWVEDHPEYQRIVKENEGEEVKVDYKKGSIQFTRFGIAFAQTVLPRASSTAIVVEGNSDDAAERTSSETPTQSVD